MDLFEGQRWDELSQPVQWNKRLGPVMEALEARLPSMLGSGIRLHRNVSWSDLEPVEGPKEYPVGGVDWPLMYLVCRYQKVLFGFSLEERDELSLGWKTIGNAVKGIPYFSYAIAPDDPSDLEALLRDIVGEMAYIWKPIWQCATLQVHPEGEDCSLISRRLVSEAENGWLPTELGEDCGLIALFTNDGGRVRQETHWSDATRKDLLGSRESKLIPLQIRENRLEKGLASSEAAAAKAVSEMAGLPLSDYLLSCPYITQADLQKLQTVLGLPDGCSFLRAAAALYRRIAETPDEMGKARLTPLMGLLSLPLISPDEMESNLLLTSFRKGRFST